MKKIQGVPYLDIADAKEDDRIELIGKAVMESRKVVAFFVDDWVGKAERYVQKLKAQFPGIVHVGTFPGLVAGTRTVKMAPPDAQVN